MTTTALEIAQPKTLGLVRPVAGPAAVIEAHAEAAALIRDALEEGVDYGLIPGAGNKKVLFKPGAERLTLAFGASVQLDIVEKEIDHDRDVNWRTTSRYKGDQSGTSQGLYRYVVRVRLVRMDGTQVGEGIGSASTMETKYVRTPRDCENTVLKMAKKRAHVDAVLSMAALSGRFTQDLDDADHGDDTARDVGHESVNPRRPPPPAVDTAKIEADAKAAQQASQAALVANVVALAEKMLDESIDLDSLRLLRMRIVDVVGSSEKMKTALVALAEQVQARIDDDTWVPADASHQQAVIWLRAQVEKSQQARNSNTAPQAA